MINAKVINKRRKIQQVIETIPICEFCGDTGIREYNAPTWIEGSPEFILCPCGKCVLGLFEEHERYLRQISIDHPEDTWCPDHPDYRAYQKPPSGCKFCKKLWKDSPMYRERLKNGRIQNSNGEREAAME